METTLIYDSSVKVGHQVDYLRFLIKYIESLSTFTDKRYIFVVSSILLNKLGRSETNKIIYISIPQTILSQLTPPTNFLNKYQNSTIEGDYIRKLIKQFHVKRIVFMILDAHIVLASRPIFYPPTIKIIGIYFRPLPNIPDNKGYLADKLAYTKKIVKACLLKYLVSFSKIEKIYISEDSVSVDWLNRYVSTNRFAHLPDPIDQEDVVSDESWRVKYSIGLDVPIYLIFGVIGARKNVLNCLKAYSLMLKEPNVGDSRLLIVGRFETEEYRQAVIELIQYDSLLSPHVIIDNKFISNIEREQLFADCRVVVMPYLNFQGASGVLGHAARYRKPVIVSNKGITAQLVKKFSLGYCVNPTNVEQIVTAMCSVMNYDANLSLNKSFLNDRTYVAFAEILLK